MRNMMTATRALLLAVLLAGCDAGESPVAPAPAPPTPAPAPAPDPEIPELPGVSFPLRSVHLAGRWGTNREVADEWARSGTGYLVPEDFMEWLESLNVNWVGLQIHQFYDGTKDSTLELVYEEGRSDYGSWKDAELRQMAREYQANDINVYWQLALGGDERWRLGDPEVPAGVPADLWLWRPGHPEHERFVAEFWETYTQNAVHFARIAQEAGVRLLSLGTETDRLFRTRAGGRWPNHFGDELSELVSRVRNVYSGLVAYDLHYDAVLNADYYDPSHTHLWDDLDLDVVGISAYFPLLTSRPTAPLTAEAAAEGYRQIFEDYLLPLRSRNPGKPLLFLEWGVVDSVAAPFEPGDMEFEAFVFSDADGNGLDDGRETQANIYEGLFTAMGDHPELLQGAFLHEQWMASDANWEGSTGPTGGAGRYAESLPRMSCGRRTAPSRRAADYPDPSPSSGVS